MACSQARASATGSKMIFLLAGVVFLLQSATSSAVQHGGRATSQHRRALTSLSQFGEHLVVNESNWRRVVSSVADSKQRIIFTTFKGVFPEMKKINANFYFWLHQQNLSTNLLLLSEDKASCEMLWEVGVPCWVDNYCPRGDALPDGQYQDGKNHWYCKYWWARELTRNGNTALFMDNDNIVLKDPYAGSDPASYDFEALSDFVRNLDRPTPKEMLYEPCGGYRSFRTAEQGQILMSQDADPTDKLAFAATPCVSAGLWFAYPRDTTIKFFDDLLGYLTYHTDPEQWDQAAFNEVLTAHLISVRDRSEQLKFRLLSHKTFANLPVYETKLTEGLEINEMVVHPCCVGNAKEENLVRIGLWKPDAWHAQWGTAIAKRFVSCMEDRHSAECTRVIYTKNEHDPLAENKAWKNSIRPKTATSLRRSVLQLL